MVVGGGNSGAQIAVELSETHQTFLSVGQKLRFLPTTIVSKSLFGFFDLVGVLNAKPDSYIGKKIQDQGDPIFGFELKRKIKERAVEVKGRTTSAAIMR
ncbi:hypothetical protein EJA13_18790 [Bacillus canaveralius]|nr:hypothetical protein EJA13_18790 [Bacillus canaveralius]